MPSVAALGNTLPWGQKASKSSAKPSLMMIQQDWSSPIQLAHLSQITITGLEPRVQLHVADGSDNFLVDTGATYSVLTSYSGAFFFQTCTILGATGKKLWKIYLSTSLLLGWTNISLPVSSGPWLSSFLIGKKFPCLWNLAAIDILIEDALKLSFGGKLFLVK